jgi:hypothetical protein
VLPPENHGIFKTKMATVSRLKLELSDRQPTAAYGMERVKFHLLLTNSEIISFESSSKISSILENEIYTKFTNFLKIHNFGVTDH